MGCRLLPFLLPRRTSCNKRNDCRSSWRSVKLGNNNNSGSRNFINSSKASNSRCLNRISSNSSNLRSHNSRQSCCSWISTLKRMRDEKEEKVTKKEKSLVKAEWRNLSQKAKPNLPAKINDPDAKGTARSLSSSRSRVLTSPSPNSSQKKKSFSLGEGDLYYRQADPWERIVCTKKDSFETSF